MSLSVVLLAAGEGKRMKTSQPKPLVMLGDMPLVQHSLNTIKKLKYPKHLRHLSIERLEILAKIFTPKGGI